MAGHTERDESLPASAMQPHKKHPGVLISNDIRDTDECAGMLAYAESMHGPVARIVKLHTVPGSNGVPDHIHSWDTLLYFPKETYDHPQGYLLNPAGIVETVPPNNTDTVRVSYVIQLK